MTGSIERNTLELLTKENERYRLERTGFLRNIREEAAFIAEKFPPLPDEDFPHWKSRCLREYYRTKGFGNFCRNSVRNPEFETAVGSLIRLHLRKSSKAPSGQTPTGTLPLTMTLYPMPSSRDFFRNFTPCTSRRCPLSGTRPNWNGSASA